MSSFAFLKPKNGLWKVAKIEKTKACILEKLTNLPAEVRRDKMNMEFLLLVCQAVEHSIDNKGKTDKLKIDKKALAIEIIHSVFGGLKADEVQTLSNNIEYLHDNGQIFKYPVWKVISAGAVEWCKKKFA